MEALSALLAICAGNSPVTGEFPAQRPLTRSFDVFFESGDLRRHRAHYDVTIMVIPRSNESSKQSTHILTPPT